MPVSSPGAALRHRAFRFVTRLRPRPVPSRLPRPAQVRALLAVLDKAVAAQQPADAAVASCGEPGPVSGQVARDCGDASSAFLHLRARLRELPLTDPDLVQTQAYAGRLLDYDQWMVHQSVNLAFTVHPDARTEAARLQLNGLGRPADDLRRLRDTLKTEEGAP
ncbi:hypothetical protein ACFWH1_09010 [Streptomyces sp. NPDC127037]|jgi:hypothetical protein|uniref:hypothetical protein n=1 Tax=Streptomyces sp. NPDC127037 TaxID=3347113 RepID=UPI00365FC958